MNGLTKNAAKYGAAAAAGAGEAADAAIEVVARIASDGRLVIEVLDSGRGLRGRTLAQLRQEFVELPSRVPTLEPPASQPERGAADGAPPPVSAFGNVRSTGMGVPICTQIAELMGGTLELADRMDGPGARAVV